MEEKIVLPVPLFLCDEKGRLRPDGILRMLIEASSTNSERLEKGMNPHKWIIYRWHLEIFGDIYWKDQLEIETSSRKIKGFYAFRNFVMYRNGEKMVEADTKWLLLHEKDLSIIKIPEKLIEIYGENPGFTYKGKEGQLLDSYDFEKEIIIRKSDIDINGHVNNAAYMEYAIEGLDSLDKNISSLQVVYKKEVKYGEKLTLHYSYDQEGDYYFMISDSEQVKTIGFIKFSA